MATARAIRAIELEVVEAIAREEVVLGQLAQPAAVFAAGQRREGLGVAQHGRGLPERADQILALREIDTGLAADRGVDLGEQRGRHLHHGNAAVIDGGREPSDIAHHTAADGHDDIGPGQPPGCELAAQVLDGGDRLGFLAATDEKSTRLDARIDVHGNVVLRDDRGALGGCGDDRRQSTDRTGTDDDVIGAFGQRDRHGDHGSSRTMRSTTSRRLKVVDVDNHVGQFLVQRAALVVEPAEVAVDVAGQQRPPCPAPDPFP